MEDSFDIQNSMNSTEIADDCSNADFQEETVNFEGAKVARARHHTHTLPNGKKTKGRVKIKMEYIGNKLRRYTTFSKRKTGIMKKAHELSTLTGTQVMLLVASETGHVYAFATHKLKPMIASEQGKRLIQHCLNAADGDEPCLEVDGAIKTEFTLEPHQQHLESQQQGAATTSGAAINARKRKLLCDSDILGLPTMVSPRHVTSFLSSPRAGPSSDSSLVLDESFGGAADEDDEEDEEDDAEEDDEENASNHAGDEDASENDSKVKIEFNHFAVEHNIRNNDNVCSALQSCSSSLLALQQQSQAKKAKIEGRQVTEKRTKTTPRPMKWTTQTLSPPSHSPAIAAAGASQSTTTTSNMILNNININQQQQQQQLIQKSLKEALKCAANQRQKQQHQLFKAATAAAESSNNKYCTLQLTDGAYATAAATENLSGSQKRKSNKNGSLKYGNHNEKQQQQQQNNNNNSLLLQQQLNAIFPFMLQELSSTSQNLQNQTFTPDLFLAHLLHTLAADYSAAQHNNRPQNGNCSRKKNKEEDDQEQMNHAARFARARQTRDLAQMAQHFSTKLLERKKQADDLFHEASQQNSTTSATEQLIGAVSASTIDADGTVIYQLPQGTVYTNAAALSNSSAANSPFNRSHSSGNNSPFGFENGSHNVSSNCTATIEADATAAAASKTHQMDNGSEKSPLNVETSLLQIFGAKFPYGNAAFQQLLASAALSQINESSRS